jgi:hypothetical protein
LRYIREREAPKDCVATMQADQPPNDALSGRGPKVHQETPWPVPAVRLNA